jgi:hypothetical protein
MEIILIYFDKEIFRKDVSPTIASLYAGSTSLWVTIDGVKVNLSVVSADFDHEESRYILTVEDINEDLQ